MTKTVSLKTARKMKELGWTKPTLFYWFKDVYPDKTETIVGYGGEMNPNKIAPAPLASEILEELPISIDKDEGTYYLEIERDAAGYVCHYVCAYPKDDDSYGRNDKLVEALASLYICLKQEGLI